MQKYMALTGEISEHIECKNIDCFTPVYLASEVDAEREKDKARIAALESNLKAMFKADDDYGCGFYGEKTWIAPYGRLRELVGMSR